MPDPFRLYQVANLSEVSPFANWLSDQARRQEPVAIALRKNKIALSTRDDCWIVPLNAEASTLALGALRVQLMEQSNLRLQARNLKQDILDLTRMLSKELDADLRDTFIGFNSAFDGDLTAAASCINQVVTPSNKLRRIEHDAYDTALLLPQYEQGAPPYYSKVAVPLAKVMAEATLFGKGEPTWWVSYHNLWVRVLAFLSGDATLAWAFHEDRDPFEAVGRVMKMSPQEAEMYLMWQTCGQDMTVFQRRFSSRVEGLPDTLTPWVEQGNRLMPVLNAWVSTVQRQYWSERSVDTRYGRRLRPGHEMGEAVAFKVYGTVEELIANAAVTLSQNRPTNDILITRFDGGPAENQIRLCGIGLGSLQSVQWLQNEGALLAGLNNPLGRMLLKPTVVQV